MANDDFGDDENDDYGAPGQPYGLYPGLLQDIIRKSFSKTGAGQGAEPSGAALLMSGQLLPASQPGYPRSLFSPPQPDPITAATQSGISGIQSAASPSSWPPPLLPLMLTGQSASSPPTNYGGDQLPSQSVYASNNSALSTAWLSAHAPVPTPQQHRYSNAQKSGPSGLSRRKDERGRFHEEGGRLVGFFAD